MPYKLKIQQDDTYGDGPRDWDNLGHMVCWHRRYNLGDEQRRDDVNDWLRNLAEDLDPTLADRLAYWEEGNGWTQLYNKASEPMAAVAAADRKVQALVLAVIDKHTVMLPLYLYDHGGLSMSTGGFSCPWDSGQVGYIYATRKDVLNEFGGKKLTKELRVKAERILRGEVKTYSQWLEGDVYGYVIYEIDEPCDCDPEPWNSSCTCTRHAEVVDSCWGYYGSDEALREGRSVLKQYEELYQAELNELAAGQVGPH